MRPELQNLPKENEHGNDGGGFEVNRDRAPARSKCSGKCARQQGGDHAVDPCHARAHGDESEHVEIAGLKRLPAALKKGPSAPENDRRRERELHKVQRLRIDAVAKAEEMPAHLHDEDRRRKREADPEPARHVCKLGIGFFRCRRQFRLERHAANRARPRPNLPDFRVHGAGIDRPLWHRRGRRCFLLQVVLGLPFKLHLASGAAKVIGAPFVVRPILRIMRVHGHAADGIGNDVFSTSDAVQEQWALNSSFSDNGRGRLRTWFCSRSSKRSTAGLGGSLYARRMRSTFMPQTGSTAFVPSVPEPW